MVNNFDGRPRNATLDTARRAVAARLREAGLDTPELDARLLAGFVTGLDLTAMIAQATRALTADEIARLEALTHRRLAGEPVARIVGAKEFWSLDLLVSADTLVPRPDTETVVRAALGLCEAGVKPRRIADLGTGSGAILLALLSEWPEATGVGTDISVGALVTARANARRLGLAARAAFAACDYGAALAGGFDLVVSNPPYIRSREIETLAPEVRDHDPRRALDGGADGLAAYRTIATQVPGLLRDGGALIAEVGRDQSGEVSALFAAAGLVTDVSAAADLSGVQRAVIGRKLPR